MGDVKTSTASAQMVHAGLAKASTRPEITPATALPSWISARMARSQFTHQARTAQIAGRKRTRHACASPHLASAMRLLRLSVQGSGWAKATFLNSRVFSRFEKVSDNVLCSHAAPLQETFLLMSLCC